MQCPSAELAAVQVDADGAQHRLAEQPASVSPGHWMREAVALAVHSWSSAKTAQLGGLQHTRLVQAPPRQALREREGQKAISAHFAAQRRARAHMLAAGGEVLAHQPSVQEWLAHAARDPCQRQKQYRTARASARALTDAGPRGGGVEHGEADNGEHDRLHG